MRPLKTQITLNEQERAFITLGVEFIRKRQFNALARLEPEDAKARGYSSDMGKTLGGLRAKLVKSISAKFRLDVVEVAATQRALRAVTAYDLWKNTNTNAGRRRKRAPERDLASLGLKLENYRRRRLRAIRQSRDQKAYEKRLQRWGRYLKWISFVLKPDEPMHRIRKNSKRIFTGYTEVPQRSDPLFDFARRMLDEQVANSEIKALVQNLRQKVRRSPAHHNVTIEEVNENPGKALKVLQIQIHDNPRLLPHLKLEYDFTVVQDSVRADKIRRAAVLSDDELQGASMRLLKEASKEPDPSTIIGNEGDVSLRCESASNPIVTGRKTEADNRDRGSRATEPQKVQCEDMDLQVHNRQAEPEAHTKRSIEPPSEIPLVTHPQHSDQEVTFGVSTWLLRTKGDPSTWDALIARARTMMIRNPLLVSGRQAYSETPVSFEQVIEESRPGTRWDFAPDQTSYGALWILCAVSKVRGKQNEIRILLEAGLEQAFSRYRMGER